MSTVFEWPSTYSTGKFKSSVTNHELLLVNWEVTCFYAQNAVARETKHFLTV